MRWRREEGADCAGLAGHDQDLFLTLKATGSHESFPLSLKSVLRQPIAGSKRDPSFVILSLKSCVFRCLGHGAETRPGSHWSLNTWPNGAGGPGNPLLLLAEHMAVGSSLTSLQASPPQRLLKAPYLLAPGLVAGGPPLLSQGSRARKGCSTPAPPAQGRRRGCTPWRGVTRLRLRSQPPRRIHAQTLSSRKHRMFQQVL